MSGGNVWTIQYEALKHTNTSAVDDGDTLDLTGLVDVKASFTTTTTVGSGDFSHVPSGSDDWTAIEQTATAGTDTNDPDMIVTGLAPGSTVEVSTQGLGNNSQAIDPRGGGARRRRQSRELPRLSPDQPGRARPVEAQLHHACRCGDGGELFADPGEPWEREHHR